MRIENNNNPGSRLAPSGCFTRVEGETYYRISSFDRMPPFFMNIPSDTDLWMYISSTGGLTAGRVDPDGALFEYQTVDKLHRSHYHTGPITLIRADRQEEGELLWEPFTGTCTDRQTVERNLYKNVAGNRLIFEEINHELGLEFSYRWSPCDEFGHIRTATLKNCGGSVLSLRILDGLRNILPFGAPLALYQQSSSLVDAYKRADLEPGSEVAVFSLTSRIIDRAEAAEELKANLAWCSDPEDFSVHLSPDTVRLFREGRALPEEKVLTGRRGNYLLTSEIDLEPGDISRWHIAADSGRSHLQVSELLSIVREGKGLDRRIDEALDRARENLVRIVGSADGIQTTGSRKATVHHYANVLYNNMRGGVFASNYDIPAEDFIDFVRTRNRAVAEEAEDLLDPITGTVTVDELAEEVEKSSNPDLIRLSYEYLPLYFGRRHGDPSRPWNNFSINIRNSDGERRLDYQGNWRDIFQNWEALSLSFPRFIPNIIAKFVNASTVDGFNPYRITREGIDWEVPDPDDPWSYIGYWGDHQIIYLLKFLETLPLYYPGVLEKMLEKNIYSYADVPYRIRSYQDILRDPESTVDFDTALASRIDKRVRAKGTDGKLVHADSGRVYHVNLLEKLLVPVLSKLSNLVPDGGIWMNTQRPEWNDANNALAGNGLSVVTLCYLRRHLVFIAEFLKKIQDREIPVSVEVAEWLDGLFAELKRALPAVRDEEPLSDSERKKIMDTLGEGFSRYREEVYSSGFSGKRALPVSRVILFLDAALEHVESSIRANRREDGLFHAYNILRISNDGKEASIEHLYEMLEGQVAALSSGIIDPAGAVDIMQQLFNSPIFSEQKGSFLLYPERDLPGFMEKNMIPREEVKRIDLLSGLLSEGDRSIVAEDAGGVIRFNSNFANVRDLSGALDRLARARDLKDQVDRDRGKILDLFEKVFRHRTFTGRSGTMYGYEGIGCIYWHMVSKLMLALQEITLRACRNGCDERITRELTGLYYRVRSGLGFERTVTGYGAFPADPYSHTPRHGGAKQPGMTGQVKEEIITRFGELGVEVRDGYVRFDPVILAGDEMMDEEGRFDYYAPDGSEKSIRLRKGSLAFTFCQVPVVYHPEKSDPWIRVVWADGAETEETGNSLDPRQSRELFGRKGSVSRIDVGIPEGGLYNR